MAKLVLLKFGEGSFEQGFPVTLQIGEEGNASGDRLTYSPTTEVTGKLPPNAELLQAYDRWQSRYRRLGMRSRLGAPTTQITNVSWFGDCCAAATDLSDRLNQWLRSEPFRPIREKWLEQLSPADVVRVIVQTNDMSIQRLPWHCWDVIERYANTEIGLSLPMYDQVTRSPVAKPKIKILAILGNSQGIDVQADRALLEQLPDAEVCFLVEPQRQALTEQIWAQPWDILFFAGHSESHDDCNTGYISINATEQLTIGQLRYALRKAVERGLRLAVFNSCDGLGLARDLADLQIPAMVVMREPVPDRVAHTFLKAFLKFFAQGELFYLAIRQARETLQGLEDQFPCATWLPVICQHPAQVPPTWESLKEPINKPLETFQPSRSVLPKPPQKARRSLARVVLTSVVVSALVSGVRSLGWLQPLELAAYDQMMRSRPAEGIDSRLLIIGITEDDLQAQERGKGSLSDAAFESLLERLAAYEPRVIGLDIYRDYPVEADRATLADRMQQSPLIAICKSNDPQNNIAGIAPPPEVPPERLGFSDFWEDSDGRLRRQMLFMTPDAASPCTAPYAFSTQIAFHYLFAEGISPTFTPAGDLQLKETVFRRLQPYTGGYQGIDAQGNQILLNYRATETIAPQVTLTQVLSGEVNPDAIKDRIILIGVTSEGAGDIWATPFGIDPAKRLLGVEVQAHMISQILSAVLDRRPLLWVWHPATEILWIVAWSLIGGLVAWQVRSLSRLGLIILVTSGLLYGGCLIVFTQGGWLPLIPAGMALILSSGAAAIYSQTQEKPNPPILPT